MHVNTMWVPVYVREILDSKGVKYGGKRHVPPNIIAGGRATPPIGKRYHIYR